MNRNISLLIGILLILLGGLFLSVNLAGSFLGFAFSPVAVWQLWPSFILMIGATFALVPFLFKEEKWAGVLFIPASVLLSVGGILMISSLFNMWGIWSWAWSLILIGLTAGFLCAALAVRNGFLAIPAFPIGITAAILFVCAVTGWWGMWAWAWTLEIIGIGAMIAYVGRLVNNSATLIVGACFAGAGLIMMVVMFSILALSTGWGGLAASAMLILLGAGILLLGLAPKRASAESTPQALS
jgi:hypothetical protein